MPLTVSPGAIRTPTWPAPTSATTASTTSTTNRIRPATEPPYSSVRRLVFPARNWCSRQPFAACTSTPWNPAWSARRAAAAKPATVARMSSPVISRGTTAGRCPSEVKTVPGSGTGEGASGMWPLVAGWPIRPPCWSWRNIRPPASRTASVTRRRPAPCAGVWMAVMFG